MNPVFPGHLKTNNINISTPYGTIASDWIKNGTDFEMNLTVPFNTKALVNISPKQQETLKINNEDWQTFANNDATNNTLTLGSGTYTLTYTK